MPTVTDIIVRKPTEQEKSICTAWPTWQCDISRFEWQYTQVEKCLVLEGQVTVTDSPESGNSVSFGPGDYVIFPNGLSCVWNVTAPVRKHYEFE